MAANTASRGTLQLQIGAQTFDAGAFSCCRAKVPFRPALHASRDLTMAFAGGPAGRDVPGDVRRDNPSKRASFRFQSDEVCFPARQFPSPHQSQPIDFLLLPFSLSLMHRLICTIVAVFFFGLNAKLAKICVWIVSGSARGRSRFNIFHQGWILAPVNRSQTKKSQSTRNRTLNWSFPL